MRILINGCSFTALDGMWPNYFPMDYKDKDRNIAEQGASNMSIFHTTMQELMTNKYDCVIIVWTFLERIYMTTADNENVNIDTLYEDFLKNIEPVRGAINPVRMESTNASLLYEPNSLDFVFIDASHDESSVKADLAAWMVRVKEDCIIAGDDFNNEGVANAVKWFFDTSKLEILGRQWMVDLEK